MATRSADRRDVVAMLVALAVVLGIIGVATAAVLTEGFDPFRGGGWCKGGIVDVDATIATEDRRPADLTATPEEAIEVFAVRRERLSNGDPFPTDQWHEHRGRWIRDMPDGSYLEVEMRELAGGWAVSDVSSMCAR